jgi:hypothetical protein
MNVRIKQFNVNMDLGPKATELEIHDSKGRRLGDQRWHVPKEVRADSF